MAPSDALSKWFPGRNLGRALTRRSIRARPEVTKAIGATCDAVSHPSHVPAALILILIILLIVILHIVIFMHFIIAITSIIAHR